MIDGSAMSIYLPVLKCTTDYGQLKVFSGYAKTILVITAEIDADFEFLRIYISQSSKIFVSVFLPFSIKNFSKAI